MSVDDSERKRKRPRGFKYSTFFRICRLVSMIGERLQGNLGEPRSQSKTIFNTTLEKKFDTRFRIYWSVRDRSKRHLEPHLTNLVGEIRHVMRGGVGWGRLRPRVPLSSTEVWPWHFGLASIIRQKKDIHLHIDAVN